MKKTLLEQERADLPEQTGFKWNEKKGVQRHNNKNWDAMLELLMQFKTKMGHRNVPMRHAEKDKILATGRPLNETRNAEIHWKRDGRIFSNRLP